MTAILVLADQPDPQTVIDSWMGHAGFDEPVETIERALAWLASFAKLYSVAPVRAAELVGEGDEAHLTC